MKTTITLLLVKTHFDLYEKYLHCLLKIVTLT